MTTHAELVEIFGQDRVNFAPAATTNSTSKVDHESLFQVGLPTRLGGIFSLSVTSDPESFSAFRASSSGAPLDFLVLGAPNPDSELRYMLDSKNGYVTLVDLGSQEPEMEAVNESLSNFIEFLYRFARFRFFRRSVDDNPAAVDDYKELLEAYLKSIDQFALQDYDSWWSMALSRAV